MCRLRIVRLRLFLVVSISIYCVLGCDMMWCNFPGHYNVLSKLFLFVYFRFNICVDEAMCSVQFKSSYCVDA